MNLEVDFGLHARQMALITQRFEPVVLDSRPDWVIVPGDVNSTVACARAASKLDENRDFGHELHELTRKQKGI